MDFIQTSNKHVDKFGVGKHGFSAGNPAGGVPATFLSSVWADGVQQELINTIEAAGLTPTAATYNQLLAAINMLSANAALTDVISAIKYRSAAVAGCAGLIEI